MKVCLAVLLVFAGVLAAQAEVKHAFICMDNGANQLVYVDQFTPAMSWTVPVPKGSRDVDLLDEDRVVLSHRTGAGIYRLKDGKKLQEITGFSGVETASRMNNGNILIGSPSGFAEVTERGDPVRSIAVEKIEHLRLARQLRNGNIIYASGFCFYEINPDGEVVWRHTAKSKTYLAIEQADGSFLSTAGAEVQLQEILRDGTERVICGGKTNHPASSLAWFSGFDLLANGNVVIANWRGHNFQGASCHLYEFDRENKIVWSWDDPQVKTVTSVQVIK